MVFVRTLRADMPSPVLVHPHGISSACVEGFQGAREGSRARVRFTREEARLDGVGVEIWGHGSQPHGSAPLPPSQSSRLLSTFLSLMSLLTSSLLIEVPGVGKVE